MPAENQELRKAGLKVTLPRVKILQILESSDQRHMTAEDVFKLHTKLENTGERGRVAAGLAVCNANDSLASVIHAMMKARSAVIIVTNDNNKYVGMTSVKDLVESFFEQ